MIEKTACLPLSIILLMTVAPRFTEARIVWDDGGQHVLAEELDPEICRNAMGHEVKACEVVNPELKFSMPALRSDGKPYCEYVFEL